MKTHRLGFNSKDIMGCQKHTIHSHVSWFFYLSQTCRTCRKMSDIIQLSFIWKDLLLLLRSFVFYFPFNLRSRHPVKTLIAAGRTNVYLHIHPYRHIYIYIQSLCAFRRAKLVPRAWYMSFSCFVYTLQVG